MYKNNYKNIEFNHYSDQGSFEIKIDKSQISRVIQNLIINSIHYYNLINKSISLNNNYLTDLEEVIQKYKFLD